MLTWYPGPLLFSSVGPVLSGLSLVIGPQLPKEGQIQVVQGPTLQIWFPDTYSHSVSSMELAELVPGVRLECGGDSGLGGRTCQGNLVEGRTLISRWILTWLLMGTVCSDQEWGIGSWQGLVGLGGQGVP